MRGHDFGGTGRVNRSIATDLREPISYESHEERFDAKSEGAESREKSCNASEQFCASGISLNELGKLWHDQLNNDGWQAKGYEAIGGQTTDSLWGRHISENVEV